MQVLAQKNIFVFMRVFTIFFRLSYDVTFTSEHTAGIQRFVNMSLYVNVKLQLLIFHIAWVTRADVLRYYSRLYSLHECIQLIKAALIDDDIYWNTIYTTHVLKALISCHMTRNMSQLLTEDELFNASKWECRCK